MKGIRPEHADKLERILDRLNTANEIKDIKDMPAILVVSRKTLSKIINERGSLGRAIAIQLDL